LTVNVKNLERLYSEDTIIAAEVQKTSISGVTLVNTAAYFRTVDVI